MPSRIVQTLDPQRDPVLMGRTGYQIETFIQAEHGSIRTHVPGGDTFAGGCQAQVDDDRDRTMITVRPHHVVVDQTLLIGKGVSLFPRHG